MEERKTELNPNVIDLNEKPDTGAKIKLSYTVGKDPKVVKKSAEEIQIRQA